MQNCHLEIDTFDNPRFPRGGRSHHVALRRKKKMETFHFKVVEKVVNHKTAHHQFFIIWVSQSHSWEKPPERRLWDYVRCGGDNGCRQR